MKKSFIISTFLFLVVFFLISSNTFALGLNITVFDQNASDSDWHRQGEDQEVEPGMQHGQEWDLEGFFLDGNMLSIVGGFNFADGQQGSQLWMPGDLFIDIGGDAVFGDIHGSSNGNVNVANTYGYDYVIDFNDGDWGYYIYEINDTSIVTTTYFKQNHGSNPWRYVSGGNQIGTGTAGYESHQVDILGFTGGYHNVIKDIDLSFLGTEEFIVHYTMQCGNDNLMGQAPVPEPTTMILFGLGLISFAVITRKKLKKSRAGARVLQRSKK